MLAKFLRGVVKIIVIIFSSVYVCLLFPAFVHLPPIGFFALANDTMTVFGVIICMGGFIAVPLSMGASIFFSWTNYLKAKNMKSVFFCLLPILVFFLSAILMYFTIHLHEFLFGTYTQTT